MKFGVCLVTGRKLELGVVLAGRNQDSRTPLFGNLLASFLIWEVYAPTHRVGTVHLLDF